MKVRVALPCAAVMVVACLTPAAASADEGPQTVRLDTHSRHPNPSVSSSRELSRGHRYIAVVSGTFSFWSKAQMTAPHGRWNTMCGTPDPAPMTASTGASNGRTGLDVESIFARPWTTKKCGRVGIDTHWSKFEIATTHGRYRHIEPYGRARLNGPDSSHTYRYYLTGSGRPARFMLKDSRADDNYGQLTITVRAASASDCAAKGWQYWHFRSEPACRATV